MRCFFAGTGRHTHTAGDDNDNDSEPPFGMASDRAVSEEMLLEMRRRNAQAAIQALRSLQEGKGSAPSHLPAISRPVAKRQAILADERKKHRARPGSIGGRAETPSEVREAAARERDEREKERGWMKVKGKPKTSMHIPPTAKRKQSHRSRPYAQQSLEVDTASQEDEGAGGGSRQADMDKGEEAEVAMRLLDLQAEGRYTEVSLKRVRWSLHTK